MSEPALHMPDVQDQQNKPPMSELVPHTSAKRHCVSRSSPLEGMPNADWVFRVGTEEKRAHSHRPYLQFCLQQMKWMQSLCNKKDLAMAYDEAYGEELAREHFPTLFERLITMWSTAYWVRPPSPPRCWSKQQLVKREALFDAMPVHRLHIASERRVSTQRYLGQHNVAHHNRGAVRIRGRQRQRRLEILRVASSAATAGLKLRFWILNEFTLDITRQKTC